MIIELAGGVVSNGGQLLLIHRSTPETTHWELPGGKVEVTRGETSADAVSRELYEELGVRVAVGAKLGEQDFSQNGQPYRYQWFGAVILQGSPHPQEAIHDNWGYFWTKQLRQMDDLSPNMQNLLKKVVDGEVQL
ncbi:MAG: NUDIX hydrolase [Candidatus Saccharibacteria bacterium]